jgi:hypothetical protein
MDNAQLLSAVASIVILCLIDLFHFHACVVPAVLRQHLGRAVPMERRQLQGDPVQ